jgi:hypothetical protein
LITTPIRSDDFAWMAQTKVSDGAGPYNEKKGVHHEAEVPPLIQEVAVHIDAIWLAEVFRDEGTNGREILAF